MDINITESLPLSSIESFTFCRRQWALKYIENQWGENIFTVRGDIFHQNAHKGIELEKRGNTIICRQLRIKSEKLNCYGICDIVEFHKNSDGIALLKYEDLWVPYPVEYKVGSKKEQECERLQLCAQAMCLEEMFNIRIAEGSLYYGKNKRREVVEFSDDLRERVYSLFTEMHNYAERNYVPKPGKRKNCSSCSVYNTCLPDLEKIITVKDYMGECI